MAEAAAYAGPLLLLLCAAAFRDLVLDRDDRFSVFLSQLFSGITFDPPQSRQLREIKPVDDASALAARPLLILHGSDDESVPSFDARVVADAHGSAELRIISGAAHDLRHDPRAVAILLGWLDRQRHGYRSPAAAS